MVTGPMSPKPTSPKLQAPSSERYKPQASSPKPKQQASSFKPQASSSMLREPSKSFTAQGSRRRTRIKLFFGCSLWKAIWCGEKRIELIRVTFSSTVKKWQLVLYPNRSGVPNTLLFSSLVHVICGVILLSSCQNLVSGLGIFFR